MMNTDPRHGETVDNWASEAGGLRMFADGSARRDLERLVDLIGLTDSPIEGSTARMERVFGAVAPHAASNNLGSEHLGTDPSVDRLLGSTGEVAGAEDRAARIARVLGAVDDGTPLQMPRRKRRWVSDLLASAAVLVACASLLTGPLGGSSETPDVISAGASMPTLGGLIAPDADAYVTGSGGEGAWWDVDPEAAKEIEIRVSASGEATVSGEGLELLGKGGGAVLRFTLTPTPQTPEADGR